MFKDPPAAGEQQPSGAAGEQGKTRLGAGSAAPLCRAPTLPLKELQRLWQRRDMICLRHGVTFHTMWVTLVWEEQKQGEEAEVGIW